MIRSALLCIAALVLGSSTALAQPEVPKDVGRAIELGHKAMEQYEKRDYAGALSGFAAADQIAHSPVFVLYVARCKRALGDLLAARELLARVAAEDVPASAPELWRKARGDAALDLVALEPRIPALLVTLRGASASAAAVTVDGAPVKPEALSAPIRLNPGRHEVKVSAPGGAAIARTVALGEGSGLRKVEIDLDAGAPPRAAKAPPPPAKGSLAPGIALLGVGGAGFATGAIVGAVALGKASEIKERCLAAIKEQTESLSCPAEEQPNIASADRLATVATGAFIAGGVAAAVGIVLVVVRPGGGRAAQAPSAALVPGPGTISIVGRY